MDDREIESESHSIFDTYFESHDLRIFKEITCNGQEIRVVEQDPEERYLKLEYNSPDKRVRAIKEVYVGYAGELSQSRERQWIEGKPSSVSIYEPTSELPIHVYRKTDRSWMSFQVGTNSKAFVTVGYSSDGISLVSLHECFSSEELNAFYPPFGLKYLCPTFKKQNGGWTYEFTGESAQLAVFNEGINEPLNKAFIYRMAQTEDGNLNFSGTQVANGMSTSLQVSQRTDMAKWDNLLWGDDRSWRDYKELMEVRVGVSKQQ